MKTNKKYIIANWKMNGSQRMVRQFVSTVEPIAAKFIDSAEVIVCPPTTLLLPLLQSLSGFSIKIGGQDCHNEKDGAHTGDISAAMLKDVGCSYVIVGHSKRRWHHGESSELVAGKAARAMENGLIPIICVGETLAEREAGQAEEVVKQQLSTIHHSPSTPFLLAYEPVWAIGSGKTASIADISAMHCFIWKNAPNCLGVLYGGSVKAANAKEILTCDGVSGVLVGGASLQAEEFISILRRCFAFHQD